MIKVLLFLLSFAAFAEIPIEAIRTTDLHDICTTKTDTIRNVTGTTEKFVLMRDGFYSKWAGHARGDFEVDHRISLQLGGTNDVQNLILQPYFGACNAHDKDKLETRLHWLICHNKLSVAQAQDTIYNHWQDGFKLYVDNKGCE